MRSSYFFTRLYTCKNPLCTEGLKLFKRVIQLAYHLSTSSVVVEAVAGAGVVLAATGA